MKRQSLIRPKPKVEAIAEDSETDSYNSEDTDKKENKKEVRE